MSRKALLYGCVVALLATLPAAGQQEGAAAAPGTVPRTAGEPSAGESPQETVAPPLAAPQAPADQDLRVARAVSRNPKFPNRAALGDEVILDVEGLSFLLNRDS